MPDGATYHNFPEEPDGPRSVTVISPKSPPVYETNYTLCFFVEFRSFSEINFQVSRILLQGRMYLFLKYLYNTENCLVKHINLDYTLIVPL